MESKSEAGTMLSAVMPSDDPSKKISTVADMCGAVCHMAIAVSAIHRDFRNMYRSGQADDGMVDFCGERTARFMQTLGDMLNAMDAVMPEDEFLAPIFAEAERLWPPKPAPMPDTKAESEAIALAKAWRARRDDFLIATHGASNRPAKVLRSADETVVFGPASGEECERWIDEQCARAVLSLSAPCAQSFQARVQPWMTACFGAEISADELERSDRFVEEVFEILQARQYPEWRIDAIKRYTFDRPCGEPNQEAGGVMVTFAALCLAAGMDMHAAGETELARVSAPEMIAKIRAKQAAKPKFSPLPVADSAPAPGAQYRAGMERAAMVCDEAEKRHLQAAIRSTLNGLGELVDVFNQRAANAACLADDIRAELAALPAPTSEEGWQPIETIPHDGDAQDRERSGLWHGPVLLFVPDQYGGVQLVAQVDSDSWIYGPDENRAYAEMTKKATHWRPLPPAPTVEKGHAPCLR